jgi:hypothetical protein
MSIGISMRISILTWASSIADWLLFTVQMIGDSTAPRTNVQIADCAMRLSVFVAGSLAALVGTAIMAQQLALLRADARRVSVVADADVAGVSALDPSLPSPNWDAATRSFPVPPAADLALAANASASVCASDGSLVEHPVAWLDRAATWLPQLDTVAELASNGTSVTFQQLRYLLTGRVSLLLDSPARSAHALSPDLPALFEAYVQLHKDVMSGKRPLRLFVVHGSWSGNGDRMRGWRSVFYLALLSGRALLFSPLDESRIDGLLLPNEIDWRVPSELYGIVDNSTEDNAKVWGEAAGQATMLRFTDAAFSDVVAVRLFTITGLWGVLRDAAAKYLCDADGVGVGDKATLSRLAIGVRREGVVGAGAYCTAAAAHAAVFHPAAPLPLGPMMELLFRPHPSLLTQSLLPLLRSLPAWTQPGPRVGVHIRTGVIDGFRSKPHEEPAYVFGKCIACQALRIAAAYPTTGVMLVSDSTASLVLRNFTAPLVVSTPLDQRVPAHIDITGDRAAIAAAYAELIALSMCDVLVIPRSGYSVAAALWSGLPLSNIKLIRRRFDSWRFAPTDVEQCPADMYHTTFYAIDLQ